MKNFIYLQNGYILTVGSLIFPEAPISVSTKFPSQTKKQELLFEKDILVVGNPNITEYEIEIKIPNFDYWSNNTFSSHLSSLIPNILSNVPRIKLNSYSLPDFNYINTQFKENIHPIYYYLEILTKFKLLGIPVFFCLQRTKTLNTPLNNTFDIVLVDEIQIDENTKYGFDRFLRLKLVKYQKPSTKKFIIQDSFIQNSNDDSNLKVQTSDNTDLNITNTTNETISNNKFERAPIITEDITKINSNNTLDNVQTFKLITTDKTRNEIRKILKEHGVNTQNLRPELQEYLLNPSYKKCPPYLIIVNNEIIDQS